MRKPVKKKGLSIQERQVRALEKIAETLVSILINEVAPATVARAHPDMIPPKPFQKQVTWHNGKGNEVTLPVGKNPNELYLAARGPWREDLS